MKGHTLSKPKKYNIPQATSILRTRFLVCHAVGEHNVDPAQYEQVLHLNSYSETRIKSQVLLERSFSTEGDGLAAVNRVILLTPIGPISTFNKFIEDCIDSVLCL